MTAEILLDAVYMWAPISGFVDMWGGYQLTICPLGLSTPNSYIFTLFDCLPLQKNTIIYSDCNDSSKRWVCIVWMQQYKKYRTWFTFIKTKRKVSYIAC
jgi:hypothetical protein